MKSFACNDGTIWLVVVVFTFFGFYNSGAQGRTVAHVALAIGIAKFLLIFFDFMEMKRAHRVWQLTMTLLMLVLFGAISLSL